MTDITRAEDVVTTTMFTPAEHAAWRAAVQRRLRIEPPDLRAMIAAAREAAGRAEQPSPETMLQAFCEGVQEAIGAPAPAALWCKLLAGEVRELAEARGAGDLVATADALADIVYCAIGIAVALGIPFGKVFAEVHRSNMTKLIPPVAVRADGKIEKGPNFDPPRIADLLDGPRD